MYVDRNKRGIPVVDFAISFAGGVCLEDKSRVLKRYYPMDKRI